MTNLISRTFIITLLFLFSGSVFPLTSSNIPQFKERTATTPTCVNQLRESGGANYAFTDFASQANGGLLCDGIYNGTAQCSVYTGLGGFASGCGGASCGWSASLLSNPWYFMWTATLSTQASHDGCVTSHGNICEDQPNVNVYLSPFTFNTATDNQLLFSVSIESGGASSCTVFVKMAPQQ